MDQAATIRNMKSADTIIRLAMCAGLRIAISKRFSIWLPQKRINVDPLITHRFAIDEAERAYDLIAGETQNHILGVVLSYDTERELDAQRPT